MIFISYWFFLPIFFLLTAGGVGLSPYSSSTVSLDLVLDSSLRKEFYNFFVFLTKLAVFTDSSTFFVREEDSIDFIERVFLELDVFETAFFCLPSEMRSCFLFVPLKKDSTLPFFGKSIFGLFFWFEKLIDRNSVAEMYRFE